MLDNINDAKTFDDVIRIRTEINEAMVRGDNHLEDVLVGLYKEETHFIFELLQNADDVGATDIEIKLNEESLSFWHNGKRDFNLKDIIAITGIGAGTKKNDDNKIGKFGIGFKSVFAATESPRIYSGDYCFEIRNFIVPAKIERSDDIQKAGTTIVLPLGHKDKAQIDIYKKIESALDQLDANAFMFLNHIQSVSWITEDKKGSLIKEVKPTGQFNRMAIMTSDDNVLNEYIIFNSSFSGNPELNVSIAYKVMGLKDTDERVRNEIVAIPNSKLSVYFLTETDTYLNFIVNGPFITSSTRESVDGSKPHNQSVLDDVAMLYKKSLQVLKNSGLVNEQFLETLPLDRTYCASSFIYNRLFQETIKAFQSDNILPAAVPGQYINSADATLARGAELTKLLSQASDIESLFGRKAWLSTLITQDRAAKLHKHLTSEHKVPEITYPNFCRSITEEFMRNKSDRWLIRFYATSNDVKEVIQILKTRPIVRTESNKMVVPFIYDRPAVFFHSTATPNDKCIKHSLAREKDAADFFKRLGLDEIDVIEDLRTNILEKFKNTDDTEKKLKYFNVFCNAYRSQNESTKTKLIELLKSELVILCVNTADKSEEWACANQAYIGSQSLETTFSGCKEIRFVSPRVYTVHKDQKCIVEFLTKLGVNISLSRVAVRTMSYEKKTQLRAGAPYTRDKVQDYDIHCLDYILKNLDISRSKSFVSLLSEQSDDFFIGTYSFKYAFSEQTKQITARFIDKLNESAWIYVGNKGLCKPTELRKREFVELFSLSPSSPVLKYLSFTPEAIELLPEDLKMKLDLIKDIPIEMLVQLKEKHDSTQSVPVEEQVIEEEPGLNTIQIKEVVPPIRDTSLADVQIENVVKPREAMNPNAPNFTIKKNVVIRTTDNKRKAIGAWGEDEVHKQLMNQYATQGYSILVTNEGFTANLNDETIQLINLNMINGNNKGYDYELHKNGSVLEYIEVKSKIGEDPELFSVSGAQWDMAKSLFLSEQGDSYVIYLVSSAGTASAKITKYRNPYKLWKEGRICADPVNLEL